MICIICRQAEIVGGLTSVKFERGEMKLVVKSVPARICPNCREAYVDGEVADQLLRGVVKASKAGMLDNAIEYNNLI